MHTRYIAAGIAVLALIACGGNEGESGDTVATADAAARGPAASPHAGMEGMGDMPMGSSTTTDQLRAYMMAMQAASGDSAMRMLPMHRQMAANMLTQFNREMAQMNMPDDAAWRATVDSLRQDLARMPEWSAAEMQQMLPGHGARMLRLMEMHGSMMGG
ncbi:MAG: hypothetical protein ACSLFE_08490 [Gemmatimonadaceae bacterium]